MRLVQNWRRRSQAYRVHWSVFCDREPWLTKQYKVWFDKVKCQNYKPDMVKCQNCKQDMAKCRNCKQDMVKCRNCITDMVKYWNYIPYMVKCRNGIPDMVKCRNWRFRTNRETNRQKCRNYKPWSSVGVANWTWSSVGFA